MGIDVGIEGAGGAAAPSGREGMGRVLVVDDDPTIRALEAEVLRGGGYDVGEASDAETALALLDGDEPFDVVLFDNRLPGLTGVEALRQLRATRAHRTLPVILVTGDDEVAARVAGLEAGADDYVIKPFAPNELLARVAARIREHTAWDEVVATHLEERAGVARVLRAASAQGSLEERVAALCDSFCEVRGIAAAAVLLFEGEATASLIACTGNAEWSVAAGDLLSASTARYFAMRAAVGPWIDGRASGQPSGLLRSGRTACAPIGHRERVNGVLALVPSSDDARDASSALAAGIDFATMTEGLLRRDLDHRGVDRRRRLQIEEVLRARSFVAHFQPIVDLREPQLPVVGVEALTRFDDGVAPETRFRFAASVGLGTELEWVTLDRALADANSLPADSWVSVNVSPTFLLTSDHFGERLAQCEREIVLELSEQEPVEDYVELERCVRALGRNVRLSVDDAGSGFASLRHILLLEPDYVKLDRTWVHDVDADPARQALIAGLVHFSNQTGCHLIAEGIETNEERVALEQLGVDYGQGFLLGFPQAVA